MSDIRLTAAQRRRLHEALDDSPSLAVHRRALAILTLDEGEAVDAIAERLGVSRQSVYNWARAFALDPHPRALLDHYGGGRPSLWTDPRRDLLRECFGHRPEDFGYVGANWTVPLLREFLHDRAGRWLSEDTIRRELDRQGYVWKRFRYVLPPDPQREKKTGHPPAA
jgi:transposase